MAQQLKIKVSEKAEGVVEKDIQNNVFNRRELTLKIFHIGTGTPSRKEIVSALSAVYGTILPCSNITLTVSKVSCVSSDGRGLLFI